MAASNFLDIKFKPYGRVYFTQGNQGHCWIRSDDKQLIEFGVNCGVEPLLLVIYLQQSDTDDENAEIPHKHELATDKKDVERGNGAITVKQGVYFQEFETISQPECVDVELKLGIRMISTERSAKNKNENKERRKREFLERCELLKISKEIAESAGLSLSDQNHHKVRLSIRLYRMSLAQFEKMDHVIPVEERCFIIENSRNDSRRTERGPTPNSRRITIDIASPPKAQRLTSKASSSGKKASSLSKSNASAIQSGNLASPGKTGFATASTGSDIPTTSNLVNHKTESAIPEPVSLLSHSSMTLTASNSAAAFEWSGARAETSLSAGNFAPTKTPEVDRSSCANASQLLDPPANSEQCVYNWASRLLRGFDLPRSLADEVPQEEYFHESVIEDQDVSLSESVLSRKMSSLSLEKDANDDEMKGGDSERTR